MSSEPVPEVSRLDSFRQALSDDAARLEQFDKSIAEADSTPGVPDDLDEISRLLSEHT